MPATARENCRFTYGAVAEEYVRHIADELLHKPLDRQLLDRFAVSVHGVGPACEVGCGPGHVTRYLHDQGVSICGLDLSVTMVEKAHHLNPGIEFAQGDMMALDAPDGAWAGVVAFYSIIHVPRADLTSTFREFRRVLRPGGALLLAFSQL